jgi:uncharacterized membrane protein YfcA
MDILTVSLLVILGCAAVMLGAVLGIGAGFIVVPVLVLIFRVPMHNAIAVSLITIVAISVSVSRINVKRGLVNIKLACILEFFCILGAAIGAMIAVKTNPDKLKTIFSAILIAAAGVMLKKSIFAKKETFFMAEHDNKKEFDGKFYDYRKKRILKYSVKNIPAALFGTFCAGTLSGLTGVGGGIINVPLLNMVCKIPIKPASATSSYMLAVTACAGALVYASKGYFVADIMLPIIIGVIATAGFGAKMLRNIKSKHIEIIFALVLILAAVRMFLK